MSDNEEPEYSLVYPFVACQSKGGAFEQFAQYVQDDWAWQRSFLSNVYGSARARGKFADSYVVS